MPAEDKQAVEEETGDETVDSGPTFTDEEITCYWVHTRECPSLPPHPLIKDKIYFQFLDKYVSMIEE